MQTGTVMVQIKTDTHTQRLTDIIMCFHPTLEPCEQPQADTFQINWVLSASVRAQATENGTWSSKVEWDVALADEHSMEHTCTPRPVSGHFQVPRPQHTENTFLCLSLP